MDEKGDGDIALLVETELETGEGKECLCQRKGKEKPPKGEGGKAERISLNSICATLDLLVSVV